MQNLSFQKFKKHLVEAKDDSPKETAEFKKLSPAEKMAVKDIYTMLNKTKGNIISKIDVKSTRYLIIKFLSIIISFDW